MYERCLDEAERILAAEKDIIVPVKKVWLEVTREAGSQGFDIPQLSDFTAMMEGDPRFEFLAAHNSLKDDLENPSPGEASEEETEMEQLGFFSGDRVKLKRIELTPQVLGTIIRSKVDRTMNALTKAWDLRPEGDQDTEDRLLEILAKTQKLQHEVKKTFSENRMRKLESSLRKQSKPAARRRPSTRRRKPTRAKTRAAGKTRRRPVAGRKRKR